MNRMRIAGLYQGVLLLLIGYLICPGNVHEDYYFLLIVLSAITVLIGFLFLAKSVSDYFKSK